MIKLLSRPEALQNEIFASFIHSWQRRFDPRIDPYMTEPGVYYDPEINKDRFFSKEEIKKITLAEISAYERLRDHIIPADILHQGELIFNLKEQNIHENASELGVVFTRLADEFQSEITFLLDYSVPWLYQKNEYFPVQNAIHYLKDKGVGEDFVGGIQAEGRDLADLVTNLFWIIRCNAGLPHCWFSTKSDPFVGNICKYGNIHFDCYTNNIIKEFDRIASKLGLLKIHDCLLVFPDSDGITGRETIV